MAQKVTSEKLQKLTFMLGQTVAALRVNEILTCRLLRWAATQSDDPRFMEVIFEATKNELRSSGKADGSTATAKVAEEALEYLDELAARIGPRETRKGQPRETKGLSPLERYQFPSFTSAPDRGSDDAEDQRGG